MDFDQAEFDIKCEWGIPSIAHLGPLSDSIIIVDVLSFSTCVAISIENDAMVYPYKFKDASANEYVASLKATLASPYRTTENGFSLSPTSLLKIPGGTRLVLPSPNGATLSLAALNFLTFTGCFRNAKIVAAAAQLAGKRISLIPAGERWPDGSIRPSFEDLVGAGAIISYLSGTKSPEAELAEATFNHFCATLETHLKQCGSGKELIRRGFERDVELAAILNQSKFAPVLKDGAYIRFV